MQCEGDFVFFSYLNGTFVRFFCAVCPHVCVELADGRILLATSWTLMPAAKRYSECTIISFPPVNSGALVAKMDHIICQLSVDILSFCANYITA